VDKGAAPENDFLRDRQLWDDAEKERKVRKLRVGIIGCGTIGGVVLDAFIAGKMEHAELVMICQRSDRPRERKKAMDAGVQWVSDPRSLLQADLHVIVEAASHEALERFGATILRSGIDLIPASVGALVDAKLLQSLVDAATESGSRLHIPSGGIGGLDAIQAFMQMGVQEIRMTSRKPPPAWKGIPYVEQLGLDMDKVTEPRILYEGVARDCVKKFPQNINIAAALSLAGLGFDRTRIRIIADPRAQVNTHEILCVGEAGRLTLTFENVPAPANPKTSYLACLSILAALKNVRSAYRVGT
jgi:aspartate dehydrogenase